MEFIGFCMACASAWKSIKTANILKMKYFPMCTAGRGASLYSLFSVSYFTICWSVSHRISYRSWPNCKVNILADPGSGSFTSYSVLPQSSVNAAWPVHSVTVLLFLESWILSKFFHMYTHFLFFLIYIYICMSVCVYREIQRRETGFCG